MIPAFLIPLIVQIASKTIELAFNAATKKKPTQQIQIFEKIDKKDKVMSQKLKEKL